MKLVDDLFQDQKCRNISIFRMFWFILLEKFPGEVQSSSQIKKGKTSRGWSFPIAWINTGITAVYPYFAEFIIGHTIEQEIHESM